MSDHHSLWTELRRRKVVRTAGLYLGIAWGAVTVAGELTDILEIADWVPRLVLLVAALGFPVTLALAWVFDWKRGGVRREEAADTHRYSRRVMIGGMSLVSLLILVVGVWAMWPRATPHGARSQTIAVLPFTVRGSDEFAYLGDGISDLLSTKLDGAGGLMTADPRAVVRLLEGEDVTVDPERAAEVATRLNARWFVLGSIVEAAGRLQVSASLYDRDILSEAVGHGRVEGQAEDVFALVDRVASDLLIRLSGGPQAEVQRVAGVTTSSLPAFKAYMNGENAYRSGQYSEALGHFERAVGIDSTFALAYYRISTAAEWAWVEPWIYEGAERAVALADRLPERERRLVEVLGVRRREANERAEEVLRSFVGTYPDDSEAWANLGELVTHTRPMHGRSALEGRDVWNRVLALDSAHAGALLHLMRLDAYEGRLDDMDARLRRFHALNPQADRSIEMDVLAVAAHGDPTAEAAILDVLASAKDIDRAIGVWNAAVYAGDLDFAVKICEQMVAPDRSVEQRRTGFLWLSSLQYARGRWSAALQALDELSAVDALAAAEFRPLLLTLPLSPAGTDELAAALEVLAAQPVPEGSGGPQLVLNLHDGLHAILRAYGMGILNARLGDTAAATEFADTLTDLMLAVDHERLSQDLALAVRARIARDEGRTDEALGHVTQMRMSAWHGQTLVSPFYARTTERFLRGELLQRVGRDDEALPWFEHIAENSPFEVALLPAALLMRGEIHAARGETAEATRLYERFLEMWNEADGVLQPVVSNTRERLDIVRGE
jgi:tetratricopeptide (TPR) repeat protein